MNKKTHKNYKEGLTRTQHVLKFGDSGLKTLDSIRLTEEQVINLEQTIHKFIKKIYKFTKGYKVWNLVSMNKTLTKLSLESRMGKGKGSIYTKAIFLKGGVIIFEFKNIKLIHLQELHTFLQKQFSCTKFVLISLK